MTQGRRVIAIFLLILIICRGCHAGCKVYKGQKNSAAVLFSELQQNAQCLKKGASYTDVGAQYLILAEDNNLKKAGID